MRVSRSCQQPYVRADFSIPKAKRRAVRRMGKTLKGDRKLSFPRVEKKIDLDIFELRGKEIFEVEGVLSEKESQSFIEFAEQLGFQHQTSRGAAFGEAYRSNDRTSVQSKELADHLWQNCGLQQACTSLKIDRLSAVGLNPNVRFYRYGPGHKFGKHLDDCNKVGGLETKYTLLIYLAGGLGGSKFSNKSHDVPLLKGGETLFYGGKRGKLVASVTPRTGLALLHLHGDDCLEHEGAEVLAGTKYVLRSDVLFG